MEVERTSVISAVIPTCRRPELLSRCLDRLAPGLQMLSAEEYEVIVTDDGLPTVEQLVSEKYPWAKWVAGPRRGPASNRNNGVRHARGEWITFTDDDCVPDIGWLAGFAGAIHDGCQVYEGKTTCVAGIHSPLEHAPGNLSGGYLWSCNMMVRADLFRKLGGFDENFPSAHMEDVDFRDRLVTAGYLFEFVPTATVDHPPRRMPSGWRLGRSHEAWLYWWYKSRRRQLASPQLLSELIRLRLNHVRKCKFNVHSVRALGSLAAEVGTLLVCLPFWERKYRFQFLHHR